MCAAPSAETSLDLGTNCSPGAVRGRVLLSALERASCECCVTDKLYVLVPLSHRRGRRRSGNGSARPSQSSRPGSTLRPREPCSSSSRYATGGC